jgi:hypothetical protein
MVLKKSIELFHGTQYQWFIRCDRLSARVLETLSDVSCQIYTQSDCIDRPRSSSRDFRLIVEQKAHVISDAWEQGLWEAVIFLDADIVATSAFLERGCDIAGELVLTPNFYPEETAHYAPLHGYFNTGFILTRSRTFHDRWRRAIAGAPWRFTDQACMNEVAAEFSVGLMDDLSNVGFWRSPQARSLKFEAIRPETRFLHMHLFQPLLTQWEWVYRCFALHCLAFLAESPMENHRALLAEILLTDAKGWYAASLDLMGIDVCGLGPRNGTDVPR